MTEQKGLILINTGTGKGKTTAALGTAIRAWGNGQKVLILQFIKGAWKYGELKAIEALEACNGNIEIRPMGDGFVFHNRKEDEAAYQNKKELAARAWETVVDEVMSDAASQKAIEDIRSGNDKAIGFLVGQIMKKSQGKANPALAQKLIRERL